MRLDGSGARRQQASLPDAEPVLLVDHDQTQRIEGDPILEEGMRADQNIDPPSLELVHKRGTFFLTGCAGKQAHMRAIGLRQSGEEFLKVLQVLLRQDLGGSDHRNLKVIANRHLRCRRGNDGFATAYVSLQEPSHRPRLFEVDQRLIQRPPLRVGELEWELCEEFIQASQLQVEARRNASLTVLTLFHQPELQQQQLIEREALVRPGQVSIVRRVMRLAVGLP
jgi:hypothetical protein